MSKPKQQIVIVCHKCNKKLVWPHPGFSINFIGLVQIRHDSCGQIVSFPEQAVWGLKKQEQNNNLAARLLDDDD